MKLIEVEQYTKKRFFKELKPIYVYHSLNHTIDVVNSAERIARLESVSVEEITLIKTAAYLHDIGILVQFKEHEKHSVSVAKEILPGFGYNSNHIEVIIGLIHSTQMPQVANSILQQIICDADLDYLGRDDYFDISLLLRKEWSKLFKKEYSHCQWYMSQKTFLCNHVYHTASVREMRNEKKMENILKVQSLLDDLM